jgi:hypothetical protein
MKRLTVVAGVVALGCVTILAWRATRTSSASSVTLDEREWEPLPRVVEVEVQNGGDRPGAARDAALRLRRARLDVVTWGNAPAALKDTVTRTVRVLVRRGDTTGSGRVAEVFGDIELIDAPDPRRLVDLTVVVPRQVREP